MLCSSQAALKAQPASSGLGHGQALRRWIMVCHRRYSRVPVYSNCKHSQSRISTIPLPTPIPPPLVLLALRLHIPCTCHPLSISQRSRAVCLSALSRCQQINKLAHRLGRFCPSLLDFQVLSQQSASRTRALRVDARHRTVWSQPMRLTSVGESSES